MPPSTACWAQIVIVRLGDSGERPLDSSHPQPQPDRRRSTIVGMCCRRRVDGKSIAGSSVTIRSQPLLPQVIASFACAATDLTAGSCWYGSRVADVRVGPNQARHEVSRVQFHRCSDAWVRVAHRPRGIRAGTITARFCGGEGLCAGSLDVRSDEITDLEGAYLAE